MKLYMVSVGSEAIDSEVLSELAEQPFVVIVTGDVSELRAIGGLLFKEVSIVAKEGP